MAESGSQPVLDDSLVASREATTEGFAPAPRKTAVTDTPPATPASVQSPLEDNATASNNVRTKLQVVIDAARRLIRDRSTPVFWVSLILHTALLLALALMTIGGPGARRL